MISHAQKPGDRHRNQVQKPSYNFEQINKIENFQSFRARNQTQAYKNAINCQKNKINQYNFFSNFVGVGLELENILKVKKLEFYDSGGGGRWGSWTGKYFATFFQYKKTAQNTNFVGIGLSKISTGYQEELFNTKSSPLFKQQKYKLILKSQSWPIVSKNTIKLL